MATDLRVKTGIPVKPPAPGKSETYVEQNLGRARLRIRLLDLAAGGLGFLALTLAYGRGVAGGLLLAMLILYVLGPQQFLSLINRAFAPFVEASIATRTQITIQQPEAANVTIPVGRAVAFAVWVDGKVPDPNDPDALKLLYRYNDTDAYEEKLLEPGESYRQWLTGIDAGKAHNGFWYKV